MESRRLQQKNKVLSFKFLSFCLLTLAAVASFALLASVLFRHTYVGIDDANIAMVYARNFTAGHGFVYNVGGERVEGFTSLLYVLIMATVFAISPFPELCLHGFCVLWGGLAVLLLVSSVRTFTADGTVEGTWLQPSELVMIAWAIGSPAFIVWITVSLMDTALWCFMLACAVTVGLWEIGNPEPGRFRLAAMSTLAAVIPLTRPEGFAIAPLIILTYALGRRLHSTRWRTILTALLVPGLAWLLAIGGITAFRIAYFGFPLPNTYYAKVSPDTFYNVAAGTRHLASFVAAQPLMLLVLGAIAAGLVLNMRLVAGVLVHGRAAAEPDGKRSLIRVAHFVVSLLAVAGLLLPVYGGGDHFEGFRFYQPIWPILILPIIFLGHDVSLGLGAGATSDRHRLAWAAAIASVPMLFGLAASPWPTQPQSALLDQFLIAEDGRRLGAALNRLFPSAPPEIAVTAAGGVKYTYEGPVFDLFGLNHVGMGHSPGERHGYKNHAAFDKEVFWSVSPPVVLPILCSGLIDYALAAEEVKKLSDGVLQGLFRDARFEEHYLLVAVSSTPEHQVFDNDPFFFIPRRFPRPALAPGAYRDVTLIGYFEAGIVNRLKSDGWNLLLLSRQGREPDREDHSVSDGPCTPRTTDVMTSSQRGRESRQ
jgi:hypothetical protein